VKLLNDAISKFDALILRSVSDAEIKERDAEFNQEIHLYANARNRSIYDAYDSIDTKATAILQHVSIMIAVTSLLYSQASTPFFHWLFGIETLVYVVLALSCLRLFMMQHHAPQRSATENVVVREALLDVVAKLTFLVTIFLVGTVFLKLVFE
jgi:hypothetical protein